MILERTKNGVRNILWGLVNKLYITVVPFVIRTVFIYTLGSEYLGLNGLFSSILSVLNLAELGFSSAIVFNMYKPIADNDVDTVCALMNYYRKAYHVIGIIFTLAGLLLVPFIGRLINGYIPEDINLQLLYLLYLFNSAIGYFLFAYKNCLLTVHQREDVISKINIVLKTIMYITQFISLIYYKNYYLFVILMIVNTILTNLVTAYFANKYYPQYKCVGTISSKSVKTIRKNIEGLMIGKLCIVSRNAFDNIFLSAFLGLNFVTIYGNYYYIMNAISGIMIIAMTSISAGIGNSVATESVEKNYNDYLKFIFMYAWIAGFCTVSLLCLYQPFMKIWAGESLMFPFVDVIMLCVYFYSLTMGDVRSQYSAAIGLFWENRTYVLFEAIVNLVLNYVLGKRFGVHGILIATWISIFFINFGWGSSIIYKHYFKDYSCLDYYKAHIYYFFNTGIACFLTYLVCSLVTVESYLGLFIKGAICIMIPNIFFFCIYNNRKEFKASKQFVYNIIRSFNRV